MPNAFSSHSDDHAEPTLSQPGCTVAEGIRHCLADPDATVIELPPLDVDLTYLIGSQGKWAITRTDLPSRYNLLREWEKNENRWAVIYTLILKGHHLHWTDTVLGIADRFHNADAVLRRRAATAEQMLAHGTHRSASERTRAIRTIRRAQVLKGSTYTQGETEAQRLIKQWVLMETASGTPAEEIEFKFVLASTSNLPVSMLIDAMPGFFSTPD